MNSAPTAEEQLPPLEPVLFWIDGMDYMRRQKEQRERQLRAALGENREKDARIEDLRRISEENDAFIHAQEEELAEKDARIAELTGKLSIFLEIADKSPSGQEYLDADGLIREFINETERVRDRAEAAEAKLRAVSDALDKGERLPRVMDTWSAGRAMAAEQVEEWRDELFARIRAILEGK